MSLSFGQFGHKKWSMEGLILLSCCLCESKMDSGVALPFLLSLCYRTVWQYWLHSCTVNWLQEKWDLIQRNLDLGKILGVTKIFLSSRFFFISNTRKPLKKHNFVKWISETIQMSYCQMLLIIFVDIFISGKYGNIFLKNFRNCFFLELL